MTSQSILKIFNDVYNNTYTETLKYIIFKCNNINDVNDIIQETYLEFWKKLKKREIEEENIQGFIIGIAKNKIKKHHSFIAKVYKFSLFNKDDIDLDIIDNIPSKDNVQNIILKENELEQIWNYLKEKKNQDIPKIFYLHYELDLKINEIAKKLDVSESYVKNLIYRTLKELNIVFKKEDDSYDK